MTPEILRPFLPPGERVSTVLDASDAWALGEPASGAQPGDLLLVTSRRPLSDAEFAASTWTIESRLFVDDAGRPSIAVRASDPPLAARLVSELTVPDSRRQFGRWWQRRVLRRIAPRRAVAFAVVLRRV